MGNMKNESKVQGKSADVFLGLAEEAESMMKATSESARKEALEETEKFLLEYEQKARQIILKTRENARLQASEIAERFKDALMQRIEEASATAMSQIMSGVGSKTEEMMQRLQQAAQSEARQALAEAFSTKPASKITPPPAVETPSKNHEAVGGVNPESFESWLTQ